MPVVEARKNVFVTCNESVNTFDFPINLEFTPDEVIVRSIVVQASASEFSIIKTNLVSEGTLCISSDNSYPSIGGTFTLNKPINGYYTFKVTDATGALQVLAGPIVIQLEFVKYKQYKK